MTKHIVSFSGGKDSTAMLLMMLERGMQVDEIVYCDTGMEFPEMYAHIEMVEACIHRTITRLVPARGWDYYFYDYEKKKGEHAGERGYGWPSMLRRWCTRHLKLDPMAAWLKQQGEYVQYIGIAADEERRAARESRKNVRHPLVEWRVTEADALAYCKERGFDWGGLYEHRERVSCWCCPLQRIDSWKHLKETHPELYARALAYDAASGYKLRKNQTLHDLDARFRASQ